ncbi:response regulator NasT [Acetitomaculum ruminis DSM 5522]|uniref:Response regulator NasT n=1 Tax=Acetitomaculum ruminis DSM 5522 TaxID=1120918 RepID=A0A1I0Z5D9_9FIRM|nr:ANTAR domain-containing protein [Acetitomaculum ruminis]SFB20825.1 response regulator NasT [Acetitomaculum ruminis DSM 5522]
MTNIMVVFPKKEIALNIKRILVRSGFSVAVVCTSAAMAINNADSLSGGIIVTGPRLPDMMFTELNEYLCKQFDMLLIASEEYCYTGSKEGIVSITKPLKVTDLINTLDMMVTAYERRKKRLKLKPKLRNDADKKIINDAKALLMDRNNMSEEEAHKYLQKCSMDSGTNMTETAHMVISLFMT